MVTISFVMVNKNIFALKGGSKKVLGVLSHVLTTLSAYYIFFRNISCTKVTFSPNCPKRRQLLSFVSFCTLLSSFSSLSSAVRNPRRNFKLNWVSWKQNLLFLAVDLQASYDQVCLPPVFTEIYSKALG